MEWTSQQNGNIDGWIIISKGREEVVLDEDMTQEQVTLYLAWSELAFVILKTKVELEFLLFFFLIYLIFLERFIGREECKIFHLLGHSPSDPNSQS